MKKIAIINGPNLNLLGKREPEIYGSVAFESLLDNLRSEFPEAEIIYYQSNIEGELITAVQDHGFDTNGIILNPGGYTHTSVALRDAITSIEAPVVEVHISNVYAREDFRHISLISGKCKALITGMGLHSYRAAMTFLLQDS